MGTRRAAFIALIVLLGCLIGLARVPRGAAAEPVSSQDPLAVIARQAPVVPPTHAARVGVASDSQPLQLILPLTANLSGLQQRALAITTQGSPRYLHYETVAQLAERYGASKRTKRLVTEYLRAVGASEVSVDATGLFANATMSAGLAQRLFSAPLAMFRSLDGRQFVAPVRAVTIPPALHGLVTGVVGLDTEPLLEAPAAQPSSGYFPATGRQRGCAAGRGSGGFTPNQYLNAYGYFPLRDHLGGQGERVALLEVDGFKSSDLHTFARCFGLHVPPVSVHRVDIRRALSPGPEATLDMEILDAAAPDLRSVDVYETSREAVPFLRSLTAPLRDARRRPQIVSASLGLCEPFTIASVGVGGLRASEGALAIYAASGTTFVASSGDTGSAGCTINHNPLHELAVSYPGSSWWATDVGGTNIVLTAGNQIAHQIVWNDAADQPGSAGGGGFSRITRPPYQNGVVPVNRRGVPDVSLLSDVAPGYAIFCSARPCRQISPFNWLTIGGTSAATPLLAGGFALIDQDLRRHHRQNLGLANPLLYALGTSPARSEVFSDVLQYSNDVGQYFGNHEALGCCTAGPGFDEASGWGSPRLSTLASFAVQLEPPDIALAVPSRQRPVRRRAILARMSCSGACRIVAFARVRVRGSGSFLVVSPIEVLKRAGTRTLTLAFTARELRGLREALRRRRRITAVVVGALISPNDVVESETGARTLVIKG